MPDVRQASVSAALTPQIKGGAPSTRICANASDSPTTRDDTRSPQSVDSPISTSSRSHNPAIRVAAEQATEASHGLTGLRAGGIDAHVVVATSVRALEGGKIADPPLNRARHAPLRPTVGARSATICCQ